MAVRNTHQKQREQLEIRNETLTFNSFYSSGFSSTSHIEIENKNFKKLKIFLLFPFFTRRIFDWIESEFCVRLPQQFHLYWIEKCLTRANGGHCAIDFVPS